MVDAGFWHHGMPPAFGGDRIAYAFSLFGLLGVAGICSRWAWRTGFAMIEQPEELRHPLTISRMILLLLLAGILMRIVPAMMSVMLWPDVTPPTRAWLAWLNRFMEGLSLLPTIIAWLASVFAEPVLEYQLIREPIPIDMYPSWKRMRGPITIGILVLFIALVLTFAR